MNSPIKTEVQPRTNLDAVKELYMKYIAARSERGHVDITDVVSLRIKAER